MTIKAVAKRTAGFGCIKGDKKIIKAVQMYDDGECYVVVIKKNWVEYFNKNNWDIDIVTAT